LQVRYRRLREALSVKGVDGDGMDVVELPDVATVQVNERITGPFLIMLSLSAPRARTIRIESVIAQAVHSQRLLVPVHSDGDPRANSSSAGHQRRDSGSDSGLRRS
jgi:hypothetical protein